MEVSIAIDVWEESILDLCANVEHYDLYVFETSKVAWAYKNDKG